MDLSKHVWNMPKVWCLVFWLPSIKMQSPGYPIFRPTWMVPIFYNNGFVFFGKSTYAWKKPWFKTTPAICPTNSEEFPGAHLQMSECSVSDIFSVGIRTHDAHLTLVGLQFWGTIYCRKFLSYIYIYIYDLPTWLYNSHNIYIYAI